jgi:hypothetical protein
MILLPKGNPVKENLVPGKINLPEALQKLQKSAFTGYLRFDLEDGTGILILDSGRLLSAFCEEGAQRRFAADAIAEIFEQSLAGDGALGIYRLSSELAMGVYALLHGELLYQGQEVKLLDIRGLLAQLKTDQISGCLRIYTRDRVALIFYREGTPLGFFHDGSIDLEKTAENSLSVAKLPGAKIDLLTTAATENVDLSDLFGELDIPKIWQKAVQKVLADRRKKTTEASQDRELQEKERRQKLVTQLKGVAEKHFGKIGQSLVEKEFDKAMTGQAQASATVLDNFYKQFSQAAKLVAGPATVRQAVEEMQHAAAPLLKTT